MSKVNYFCYLCIVQGKDKLIFDTDFQVDDMDNPQQYIQNYNQNANQNVGVNQYGNREE